MLCRVLSNSQKLSFFSANGKRSIVQFPKFGDGACTSLTKYEKGKKKWNILSEYEESKGGEYQKECRSYTEVCEAFGDARVHASFARIYTRVFRCEFFRD
ncbi:hypothetical protein TNCT_607501 [Trichonephila clavata]|uniref:Uncharacterized protein n=1 Tax=Trichonephila clavata TaxID=2740835 RepID=A0A8X6FJ42_TRICU|nr:hypothetical protein TNCT_607501 [Trichonephila clavata]